MLPAAARSAPAAFSTRGRFTRPHFIGELLLEPLTVHEGVLLCRCDEFVENLGRPTTSNALGVAEPWAAGTAPQQTHRT
jgi:hypothetical protein